MRYIPELVKIVKPIAFWKDATMKNASACMIVFTMKIF